MLNRTGVDRLEPIDQDADLSLLPRYLREISATPLLTAEEEVDLASRIEAGVYAAELVRTAERTGRQPAAASLHELRDVAQDGQLAKDRMIRANLRLVVSVAKKYAGRGRSFLDVIQDGNLGLIRAVEKFDYAKGFKFSTYATWWIRQAIQRGLTDQRAGIRLPVHTMETLATLHNAERKLTMRLGGEPSVEDLVAETGMTVERIEELRRAAAQPVSLDTPVGDDGIRVIDLIEDLSVEQVADVVGFQAVAEALRAEVDSLPVRDALILTLRYGLDNGSPRSLQQIGDQLGLTSERIRQLQNEALAKLRDPERRASLVAAAS
ncbi:sigma-70 family RNA polymerase sigma factor [Actinopolymorpha sp. B11F2]|uniref:sigma-70 family RNA polymerase sigma factor n=1 Tax=Actinopolymorpha sp. B11F2 TaxID=3160862 RepID=UPI0032E46B49